MNVVLFLLFLFGSFCSSCLFHLLVSKRPGRTWQELLTVGKPFWYFPFHRLCFRKAPFATLLFASRCAQMVSFVLALFFLFSFASSLFVGTTKGYLSLVFFLLFLVAFLEYLPRILIVQSPTQLLPFCSFFSSFFLFLTFPFTFFFRLVSQYLFRPDVFDVHDLLAQANEEIIEIIEETNTSPYLDSNDKRLISQVVRFRDRIAREIMVPRVDIFSLPATTSIKEAAQLLEEEGYSRTPVYRDSIDDIIGVLMYKDILQKYREYETEGNQDSILQAPIETIMKNVLFTPETKKISLLLHEFRRKQTHLAIVVDEYGGTEGLVTIEDILEEIVGEIEDEYDIDESLFLVLPQGGWLVDGRMNILDIADQLHIQIPQEGDYDTIGGFVFHRTGVIPSKGFVLDERNFAIEILRSNNRRVEKIRLEKKDLLSNQDIEPS